MLKLHNFSKYCHLFGRPQFVRFLTTSFSDISLTIDPPSCMQDEPVKITCHGLNAHDEITLTNSAFDERGKQFVSISHFRADINGCIDLLTSKSLGGSFKGIFPMGPFITLESLDGPKGLGFFKKNESPFQCDLSILRGHQNGEAAFCPDPQVILAKTSHERLYIAPGVETIKVDSGRIRGKLFIPPGDGPFPGVIDLYGTSGGLNPTRASLLASRGIAALSLAFFNYEDLPKLPEKIELSYFEEAIQFLLDHPKVLKPDVGVIGLSKGGDIALAMGTFIDAVKATVTVNCIPGNTWWPLEVRDKLIPSLPLYNDKMMFYEDDTVSPINVTAKCKDHPECCIPIENADSKFLFIAGEDDRNWDSMEIHYAIEKLKAHKKDDWKLLSYKGAGHFLNPPYSALVSVGFHGFVKLYFQFGGKAKETSDAQVHSWEETLKFFKTSLKRHSKL